MNIPVKPKDQNSENLNTVDPEVNVPGYGLIKRSILRSKVFQLLVSTSRMMQRILESGLSEKESIETLLTTLHPSETIYTLLTADLNSMSNTADLIPGDSNSQNTNDTSISKDGSNGGNDINNPDEKEKDRVLPSVSSAGFKFTNLQTARDSVRKILSTRARTSSKLKAFRRINNGLPFIIKNTLDQEKRKDLNAVHHYLNSVINRIDGSNTKTNNMRSSVHNDN